MELDELITIRNLSDVQCVLNNRALGKCSCHITSHHLMMVCEEGQREVTYLHKQIDSIEQVRSIAIDDPSGSQQQLVIQGPTIVLKTKDFSIAAIVFQPETSPIILSNLVSTLSNLSNVDNVCFHYPFYYSPETPCITADGWESFNLENEFRSLFNASFFRISLVNKDFTVCDSYPKSLVVPKTIPDEILVKSAAFRRNYRFPVASYCHSRNGAVLVRSGEPLIGQNSIFRSKEDELLLNGFLKGDARGVIIDTRSQSLIKPRQNRGGGIEPLANYPRWAHQNMAIDRPESMKRSFEKLIELLVCRRDLPVDGFLDKLSSSSWLHVVRDVMNCACVAAQIIDRDGKNVLIHGSDGTDSTLAVSSLSQVVLSSDCRTIRGFLALIDREWINAGHPFRTRCFKGPFAVVQNRDSAPTFLVFLDCVWQIMTQFPCSFEFTEKLLIEVFRHAYFSQFGTFLCNNVHELEKEQVKQRTMSLWSHLLRPDMVESVLNPLYEPTKGEAIWPSVQPVTLDIWRGLYMANVDPQSSQVENNKMQKYSEISSEHKELMAVAIRLKRQLKMLEFERQQLLQQGNQPNNKLQQQMQDPLANISVKSSDSGISGEGH